MRAHHLQHASFEGLGSIKAWLQNAGYEISITKVCESMKLPSPNEIDLLVLTGGPMSVNDEFSWLFLEKEFVRRVIEFSKPVLGICLGAQLMANAMGGEVFPNPVKEIGWFPVQSVATKPDTTFVFPESTRVFHWHSETFSLPPGAIRIAESAGCQNQAFQMGKSVIGLQFHLETTSESAQELVSNCKDELVPSRYVQREEDILSNRLENYAAINQLMANLLSYLMLS
ncbi:Glutamine amidotransferase, class I [Olavius algarvensis spirochete endosymbiont]|uniref:type 1 glutamine amidotransferase n=1 Tax=Olavius algarvensis spirochete endosymbiont TaxID=260710 RepID=UPI000F1E99F0|nr:type 1 glutamine amidotransferase [Olavius algarvensis spirochete endosymbiont]VDB00447.1 Glutamine amidotransferase, class I [Olavius algarvensis spirochete endosymbiont]